MWIDLDGTVVVVDEDETKANIGAILTNLTGKQVVVVEIKTDNNGKLTQVVVVVSGGDEAAQALIDVVQNMIESGTSEGVLRPVDVGVVVDVSSGKHTKHSAFVVVVVWCFVLCLVFVV